MPFNFTETEYLYFSINTAVNVVLFLTIVLPTLILCLLCMLATFFAEGINWPIRVLLINLFAADICTWTAVSVLFLGYPVRAGEHGGGYFSCSAYVSLVFVGVVQEFSGVALYTVTVYVFLKHGLQKLKWHYIYVCLALSWIVSMAVGLMPYFNAFGTSENDGFCETTQTSLFKGYIAVVQVGVIILFIIIMAFCMLTYYYVRKNPLHGNITVKKSIVRYLLYLNIAIILSFMCNILPASFSSIRNSFEGEEAFLGLTLIKFLRLCIQLPSIISPVAAILIIKPIAATLKQGFKRCTQSITDEEFKYSDAAEIVSSNSELQLSNY